MFLLHDELEQRFQACINDVYNKRSSPLIFGHICWGVLTKPGAFRMTKIHVGQGATIPLNDYQNQNNVSHEEAFRRHIIRFGRSGTLLDWLTLWMYDQCQFVRGKYRVSSDIFSFLISKENEGRCFQKKDKSLEITRDFYDALIEESIVDQYFRSIYSMGQPSQNDCISDLNQYYSDLLIGSRFAALEMIKNDPDCMQDLNELSSLYPNEELTEPYRNWIFLGALQTSLMYVFASRDSQSIPRGFTSIGSCYNIHDTSPPEENPLAILSVVLPDGDVNHESLKEDIKVILEGSIEVSIRKVITFDHKPIKDNLNNIGNSRWDPRHINDKLSQRLSETFETHAFPGWAPALLLWLSLLIEKMRESIHEGEALDFCFVVADESQIMDSGLFEIVNLNFSDGAGKDDNSMVPWKKNGDEFAQRKVEELIEQLKRMVSKRNYAWFQEGKYALLWDATFPNRLPKSLIRFKDSSWDLFIRNCRMGKETKATRVVATLAYVRGDGSGGSIVKGKHVLVFRKAQPWDIEAGERYRTILSHIDPALKRWALPNDIAEKTVPIICKALHSISDDPHTGCMLVIFNEDHTPNFEDMGEPWHTEHGKDPLLMTLDELTALMSMDGATCIYFENSRPNIVFRRLVSVPENPMRELNEDDKKKHLIGEGSRKWSGVFAARRSDVDLVIAVSQDGPIYVYKEDEATSKVKVAVF